MLDMFYVLSYVCIVKKWASICLLSHSNQYSIYFSVPTKDAEKLGCFAYGSTVRTKNKGVIPIEYVRTGDKVESMTTDGEVVFSDVIMIMHQVK